MVIFPEGVLMNCNVFEGQLSGWAVICRKNIYCNILSFKRGRFEGRQYSYDMEKGMMSESEYRNGKLHCLKRCEYEKEGTF